jgi:anti-sigma factor RsiW
MNPIDPVELSAYLDGELSPARAREVETALASSPALRAELDALAEADKTWRAAARSAAFRPDVRLRGATVPKVSICRTAGAAALLLAVRFLPKLAGALDVELIANGIALAIVIVWVIRMTGTGARQPYR